jgi:hypothetical protein
MASNRFTTGTNGSGGTSIEDSCSENTSSNQTSLSSLR